MKKVENKLRVVHIPQVGCSKSFVHEVMDEEQALFTINLLAAQHIWLYENKFIPDFSNIIFVEMYDEDIDEETTKPYGWVNYWNEQECMEWEDVVNELESQSTSHLIR